MTRNDFDHRHIWSGTCLQPVLSTTQFTHFFTSSQTSPSLGIRLGTIIRIIMVIIITINFIITVIIIMIRMVTTTTLPLQCLFCHWLAVVLCSTTMVTIISIKVNEDDHDDHRANIYGWEYRNRYWEYWCMWMIITIIQSLYGDCCGRNILLIMDLDAPDWHYFQAPGTFIPSLYISKHFSNQTLFVDDKNFWLQTVTMFV